MKINNKKGFIMIETLITSVFLLSLFGFLYINIIPLNARYLRTRYYDDISSVYGIDEVRTLILSDESYAYEFKNLNNQTNIVTDMTNCNKYPPENLDYCEGLKDILGIKDIDNKVGRIFVSKYELTGLKLGISVKSTDPRFPSGSVPILTGSEYSGFREYINYLPKYTVGNIEDGYRLFIIRNVEESGKIVQRYANIELFIN